jgi:regulator of nonsense transcripts 1
MDEIGIVTPYGSQVREIRRELGPSMRDVECHSVDGFQGREKTVIVFSAVRANSGGHVGFLADWCRTNVAVTRAKNGLVVIGNEVRAL